MKIGFNLSQSQVEENCWPAVLSSLYEDGHTIGLFTGREELGQESTEPKPFISFTQFLSVSSPRPAEIDSAVVSAATDFWQEPDSDRFRIIALKLLNRLDFSGTFRLLDREVILSLAVLHAFAAIRQEAVDLLIFEITPHEFIPYVLHEVSKSAGVAILSFEAAPIAPVLVPHGVHLPESARVDGTSVSAEILRITRERVAVLRGREIPQYIALQKERDAQLASRGGKTRAKLLSLRWLLQPRFSESAGSFSGHNLKSGLLKNATQFILNRSLEQNFRREARMGALVEVEPPRPFALFALHYEPEKTSLPDGLPILFQGDAVVAARDLVPDSIELLVKEHYSQTSAALRGYLGRSPLFYRLLSSISGITLSRGERPAADYVGSAECVFTLTGTIAIESVFMGVPAVYFGSPWWEGLPGTLKFVPGTTWADIQAIRVPRASEVQDFLETLILSRTIPGISAQKRQLVERRLGPLPAGLLAAEAGSITACIRTALSGLTTGADR